MLTKVIHEQQGSLKELQAKNEKLEQRLLALEGKGKTGRQQVINRMSIKGAGLETALPFLCIVLLVIVDADDYRVMLIGGSIKLELEGGSLLGEKRRPRSPYHFSW